MAERTGMNEAWAEPVGEAPWAPVAPAPGPLPATAFLDGVSRVEARVFVETGSAPAAGLCGSVGVGAMLTSFGVFWTVEGARVHWPGGDAMLPALVAAVAAVSSAAVASLRRTAGGEARRS